jgi:hypothetical protein
MPQGSGLNTAHSGLFHAWFLPEQPVTRGISVTSFHLSFAVWFLNRHFPFSGNHASEFLISKSKVSRAFRESGAKCGRQAW